MEELFLDQFNNILQKLKTEKKEYRRFIRYDYYLVLEPGDQYSDVFMEDFFEFS